ncbi:MAG TPA: DNA glycosylase, partial [Candidatus Aquilonibacter sp.]|nr:DNA glycosylase [Candidatus Aquilonibacter sp.]
MGKIKVADFDIRYTAESAQPLTFFGDLHEEGKRVKYVSNFKKFDVRQHREILEYSVLPEISEEKARQEIVKRFGLKDNMQKIYESIATDQFLVESIEKYPGMRITRNDPWETTVCFVMSQFNN